MATFKDLQDRINLDYLNRTDLSNETKRAIIRAIKHYERTRLWFNQTATAVNASTATNTLAVPADFISLDFMTYTVNAGAPQLINQHPVERINYRAASGLSGSIEEVAIYRNLFYFYPKPSSAFPVTVNYIFRLATLSADTDTNLWCDEAEDLIVFHAAADMLANVIRGRPDDVQTMRDMESQALASLQIAKRIHMNTDEDLSVLGPVGHQDPNKSDGGGGGQMSGNGG